MYYFKYIVPKPDGSNNLDNEHSLVLNVSWTEGWIIVGCVYRPPNKKTVLFLEKFNDILSIITEDTNHCYVMGDFNLDLLQYNHHLPTQQLRYFRTHFFLLFQIQLASPLTLQH